MKKIKIAAICMAMAICSFLAAPVASAAQTPKQAQTSWISQIPVNLVIEQKATLSDGRTVTLYYQKKGDICEVYTNDTLDGYNVSDLIGLRDTSFRVVSSVKGKRVYYTTVAQACKLIKRLVNTYL